MNGDQLGQVLARFALTEPDGEAIGPSTWTFPFTAEHGLVNVFLSVHDAVVLVYAAHPEVVPRARWEEVSLMIADLNPQLTAAWLECQRESGVIAARTALDATDLTIDSMLVGNLVGSAVGTMDRFRYAIDAVREGRLDAADLREEEPLAIDDPVATDIDELRRRLADD